MTAREKLKNKELQYAIQNRNFAAAVVIVVFLIVFLILSALIPELKDALAGVPLQLPYFSSFDYFFQALSGAPLLFCIPIVCTFPYASAFLGEWESGEIRFHLSRTTKGRYIRSKIKSVALSGGMVLIAGIGIAFFLTLILLSPFEMSPASVQESVGADPLAMQAAQPLDNSPNPVLLWVLEISPLMTKYFLSGAFWALLGAFFATISRSRFMAYAAPFVFYYILIILFERYVKDIFLLDPREWVLGQESWPGGGWGSLLFLSELTVIAGILFSVSVARRIESE